MYVAELWRFPVKSMAGEPLEHAELGPLGIEGDRVVKVVDGTGRLITARTHPRLLAHHAVFGAQRQPLVDGRLWSLGSVGEDVEQIVGPGAKLVRDDTARRFDILPLLVATDGAIDAFGYDGRRLRPNIVIGDVPGLLERTWQGRCLRIGSVVIGLTDLRGRCVMTTYDPDTREQNRDVLASIVRRFEGKLALNAAVLRPGLISRGDEVELMSIDECSGTAE